jgi:hypothetical protein
MRRVAASILLSLFISFLTAGCLTAEISRKNIRFVNYPDFPDAHSSWGSIGYNKVHKKINIGVTNYRDKAGLFEYDVISENINCAGS